MSWLYQILTEPIWSFVTAFSTALIVLVAYFQLKKFNATTVADFIDRFKKHFFIESTRNIMALLQYGAFKFKVRDIDYGQDILKDEFPYFEMNKNIDEQLKNFVKGKEIYSAYEVDDELLGQIDDLGTFEKRGILDISMIYEIFDYYIEEIWENEEIRKYVEWQRTGDESCSDIYDNLEYIYNKCKSYGEAKRKKQWIWLWRMKWKLFESIKS
ncbi:MAG: hypothetical protein ACLQUS_14820 [Desulfobaccales bacterium]